jgi:hypothetical protein
MEVIINFINNFGQRKFARLLTIITIITGMLGFVNRHGIEFFYTISPYVGIIILALPHWFLALAAEKTKSNRMFTIFCSAIILLLNFILFFFFRELYQYLVSVLFIEIILSLGFYIKIVLDKNKQKI